MKIQPESVIATDAGGSFCDLCEKETPSSLLHLVNDFRIVRCRECGLAFLPRDEISRVDVAGIYSREYFEGGRPDGYTDYGASEEVLRRQARRTLGRLRRHRPGGSLLEIGCAYGYFLMEARRWFNAKGLELSDFAAAEARRRGLDVRAGDFFALPAPPSHYDAVCLFDTIEHLTHPSACLRKIHDVLKPGGVVALTTGDVGSFYARVSGARWRLMTPPQHVHYFSRATLEAMLVKTGFEVLEVTYPWKVVPWRLALYQLSPKLKAALGRFGELPFGLWVNLLDAMRVLARRW